MLFILYSIVHKFTSRAHASTGKTTWWIVTDLQVALAALIYIQQLFQQLSQIFIESSREQRRQRTGGENRKVLRWCLVLVMPPSHLVCISIGNFTHFFAYLSACRFLPQNAENKHRIKSENATPLLHFLFRLLPSKRSPSQTHTKWPNHMVTVLSNTTTFTTSYFHLNPHFWLMSMGQRKHSAKH